jgi:L-asparaginase
MERSKTIGLLVVPGTIDAVQVPGSRLRPGMDASARVSAEEMAAALARHDASPALKVLPGPDRLSHHLGPDDWLVIARRIQDALDAGAVDAVVVTHGTNNLEEFAYFLTLTVRSPKPVVVTGAMLPWNDAGSDGVSNLRNAVQVAASGQARSRGILVAFGRDVFDPRHVTKISTDSLSAFAAPGAAPIASLHEDGDVRWLSGPRRPAAGVPSIDLAGVGRLPRVDVIVSQPGGDGALIDAAAAAGAAGLVTAAGGRGVTSPDEFDALLRAAARGVIVCQASRVSGGNAPMTEERLDHGFVAAGDLNPWKARILLMLALSQTRNVASVRRYFETY